MDLIDNEYLFDKQIIADLNVTRIKSKIDFDHVLPYVGRNFIIRPLSINDFSSGFLNVLKQLTEVGNVSKESFIDRFRSMKNCSNTYYIMVIEDLNEGSVFGTGTLVVEQKFIHQCSTRARIEDIVVSHDYRGQQFGKILLLVLISLAEKLKCYKVTLECKDSVLPFYESLGFTKEVDNSNYLQIRFDVS